MPFERTPTKIKELLSRVYDNPEISDDLERTGTRRDVLGSALEARTENIWRSATEQINAFNGLEHSEDSAAEKLKRTVPRRPRYFV
ncbi:MAG: hypothetical protein WCC37_24245 [Candidatus Sulfotelmatobacter sp.]